MAHVWKGEYELNIVKQYWAVLCMNIEQSALVYLDVSLKFPTCDAGNVAQLSNMSEPVLAKIWYLSLGSTKGHFKE